MIKEAPGGVQFEWDEAKAESNFEKHKVSFEFASEVFLSEQSIRFVDTRFEYGETREIVIGAVEGIVLIVTFTMRDDRTRIISARRANRDEVKKYHGNFT